MPAATYSDREMLAHLVAFDTTSSKSNLALIDWVEDYLAGHGVAAHRVWNEKGNKANLYATIGPEREGGVVLSGHTDVVPVDGQPWNTDPWVLTEKDGRLYGRGSADMKGFIACGLALVPHLLEAKLNRPVHFALSYDEEVGCLGAPGLAREMAAKLPVPAAVIVGEPSMMRMIDAHKGTHFYETVITGREAHASTQQLGASAVMAAAELCQLLNELRDEMIERGDPSGRFEPPYATINVGMIHGGTAFNIIARECRFLWEFRALPDMDPDEIPRRFAEHAETVVLPRMREIAPEAQIVTQQMCDVPPLAPEEHGVAEALVRELTGQNATATVPFGTEGGIFQEAGMSTIVCGPGSIDQAHQPDEFIAIDQLEACTGFLARLGAWASKETAT